MIEDNKDIIVSSNSPAMMMQMVLEKGGDLEKLEKLLELQERYDKHEAMKAYHVAMAEFKKEPIKILKDKHVAYQNRDQTWTKYDHASLANVTETINSKLSAHGFSTSWKTEQAEGKIKVTCTVTHSMGHSESTSLESGADASGGKNPIQAIGSTVSYLNRYTLLAITGQATYDQDDDGKGSEQPKEKSDDIVISSDQLTDLKDKMKEKNVSEDTILREYGKKNLWTLNFGDYKNAIDRLDK